MSVMPAGISGMRSVCHMPARPVTTPSFWLSNRASSTRRLDIVIALTKGSSLARAWVV